MSRFLTLAGLDYSATLKLSLLWIGLGGFLVAVVIGSIAWYNSKKPAGWENSDTPNWVPKVGSQDTSASDTEQSS